MLYLYKQILAIMKKVLIISIAILVAAIITSCKKGENDPILSIKSRTARITGEWKLSAAEYTVTENYGDMYEYYFTSYSYDGTKMTENVSVLASGQTFNYINSYNYSMEYEFSKNGAFRQTENESGTNAVTEGFWAWSHEVPEQELKNKESIILSFTSGEDFTYTGQTIPPSSVLILDRLTSDEIVILLEREEILDYGTITYTGSMTFKKK